MKVALPDLDAFVQLGVRLPHRTTRSVSTTEAGARLLERLSPALGEIETALDVVNSFRDRPAGTLRLNVPVSAARLVLPQILPRFLAAYPTSASTWWRKTASSMCLPPAATPASATTSGWSRT
jgi:DNA-binding transcriptional LysR family regulator